MTTQTLRRPRRADLPVVELVVRKTRCVVPPPAPAAALAARERERDQDHDDEPRGDLPQRRAAGVRHHPLDVHLAHEGGLLLEHLPTLEAGARAGRRAAAFASLVPAVRIVDDNAVGLGVRGAVRRRAQVHLHRVEHDLRARQRLPTDSIVFRDSECLARPPKLVIMVSDSRNSRSARLPLATETVAATSPSSLDATSPDAAPQGLSRRVDTRPHLGARVLPRRGLPSSRMGGALSRRIDALNLREETVSEDGEAMTIVHRPRGAWRGERCSSCGASR